VEGEPATTPAPCGQIEGRINPRANRSWEARTNTSSHEIQSRLVLPWTDCAYWKGPFFIASPLGDQSFTFAEEEKEKAEKLFSNKQTPILE